MSKLELISRIARAIAEKEGFYVTLEQAKARGIRWPTRAQRNANPGNIRRWKDSHGRDYPTDGGYVDFIAWASDRLPGATLDEISEHALAEGWRILKVLVGQYIDGRYTDGKSPTLEQMFRVYAPASDRNDPGHYARFVAARTGLPLDQPLAQLADGSPA